METENRWFGLVLVRASDDGDVANCKLHCFCISMSNQQKRLGGSDDVYRDVLTC